MQNAIEIENLWKKYRLGVIDHGTLSQDLQSWWAKVCGKEDPNAEIIQRHEGQEQQISGQNFWALQGINLKVGQGDLLGIIGKNGAGKSTLLKILSRITAPTKGTVRIKGRVASLLEVGTGFHPELTGRENIYLNGTIMGMFKDEVNRKIDEIIDFSGVEKYIDTPVKRYSSGMRVRLGFAVAAHLEPEILIVDEVLAVGDAEFQRKCLGKMKDVSSEGRTVLFVSHNMPSIHKLCEKCALLSYGKIEEIGESGTIIDKYLAESNEQSFNLNIEKQNENSVFHIDRVELLDLDCEEIDYVYVDESFIIRIYYCPKEVHKEFVLGINFYTQDGLRLGALASRGKIDYDTIHKNSHYYTDVKIKNVFTPNRIRVEVNVKSRFGYVNFIEGLHFEVVPFGRNEIYTKAAGCVLIPASWENHKIG